MMRLSAHASAKADAYTFGPSFNEWPGIQRNLNQEKTMLIERRSFLKLPAFAAIGTLAGIREEFEGPITFDAFVAQVGAMAKRLIAEAAPEEENYLQQVAALTGQIDRVPDATMGQPYKEVMRTGMNYRGSGIVVIQWSMEAGLTYPAHNHPHYNGVTMGLEGECRIRNF